MDQPEKTTRKRWRWLRFSLRTLLLAALFAGSCGTVWWMWEPWPAKKLEHPFNINEAKFSPDGQWVLTWGYDGLLIWDARTAQESLRLGNRIEDVAWAPDSKCFATALEEKTIRIWDRATGKCLKVLKTEPPKSLDRPEFSPDGTRMISALYSDDGYSIWDIENEKCLAQLDDSYHFKGFSKDGKLALFSIWVPNFYTKRDEERERKVGKGFELWNMDSGTRLWHAQLSENDSIPTLSFSEDDQRVMANYEWREEMKIPDEINPENDVPHTVEFLTEWDIKTGSKLTEKKVREGKGWTSSFSIGHNWQTAKNLDQSRKVTLEPNFQLAVRDAKTDAVLVILPQYHARTTSRKAEFSPDGTQIVGANYFFENAVYLWTRNYPERWWGIAWMPTFWVAMVLFAAAVFSFWRDLKSL